MNKSRFEDVLNAVECATPPLPEGLMEQEYVELVGQLVDVVIRLHGWTPEEFYAEALRRI